MPDLAAFARFFGLAFSALLPVVNPLGSALVFLGLVGDAPASAYRELACRIAIYTTLFFLVVELVGTALLAFLVFLCPSFKSLAAWFSPPWAGACSTSAKRAPTPMPAPLPILPLTARSMRKSSIP
jgi:hypothetical protein